VVAVAKGSFDVQGITQPAHIAIGSVSPHCICLTLLHVIVTNSYAKGIACVYEPKQKPGLKAGAVEALTRRVGA
jgi:hypothetical protein